MRVRLKVRTGSAVCWNGSNVDEVRAVAGDNFVGLHSDHVLVRNSGPLGDVCWVRPGWWITRWDGADDIRVFSAGAFAGSLEAEPEPQESATA